MNVEKNLGFAIPGDIINYYRNVYNDTNIDYRHYADICYKIRRINAKDIERCNEDELSIKLFIEAYYN